MDLIWKNIHIIQRICSSIIYGSFFIYVIIQNNTTLFHFFSIFLLIGSLYELNNMSHKLHVVITIILAIYIIIAFYLLNNIQMRENGDQLIIVLLFQIWASDIGGYIIGKTIGKKKFSYISPKKTWEGLLGSFIFCLLIGYSFQEWIAIYIKTHWIILSGLITISCVIGDLIISKIKRLNHKKNSGFFLPGHGGFLDRLDSLFFSILTYYLIICM